MKKQLIDKAVEIAGSQVKLADATGYSQNLISLITLGKRRVSAEFAIALEHATGIVRCEFRPDLFPAPQSKEGDAQ